MAIGTDLNAAVVAGYARSHVTGDTVDRNDSCRFVRSPGVRSAVAFCVRYHVAGCRVRYRVFRYRVRIGSCRRDVVHYPDVERVGRAVGVPVFYRDADAVEYLVVACLAVIERVVVEIVGVVHDSAACCHVRCPPGQMQRPVLRVDSHRRCRQVAEIRRGQLVRDPGLVRDRYAPQPVRCRDREEACHRIARSGAAAVRKTGFVHRLVAARPGAVVVRDHDRRAVVLALDRYRERCRRRVAVAVTDRVLERLGQAFARRQLLHRLVRVVERVGVLAIGTDLNAAVVAGYARSHVTGDTVDRNDSCRFVRSPGVRSAVAFCVRYHVAGCRVRYRVFRYRVRIGSCRRDVVHYRYDKTSKNRFVLIGIGCLKQKRHIHWMFTITCSMIKFPI